MCRVDLDSRAGAPVTRLHADVVGSGPDVLLIHGLPSPPGDMLRLGAQLGGVRAIVPALVGYGKSARGAAPATLATNERSLVGLLADLGAHDVVVVGFSMGAYRALALALSGAVRVRALVLLGGLGDLSSEERDGMRGFAQALRARTDLRAVAGPRFLSPTAQKDAALVQSVEGWLGLAPNEVMIEELDDLAVAEGLLERARSLDVPALVRVGELDLAAPPSHSERLATALPRATLQIVPGRGHALLLEDFEATRDAVRAFLAELPA